jgi:hypothetical protein
MTVLKPGPQRGFIALYAIVTLAFLLGLVVLVLARWEGYVRARRIEGATAQADRMARTLIHRQMLADAVRTPRLWIPPLAGEEQIGGMRLTWSRLPLEGRWRMGARPWRPEWIQAWEGLGAKPDRLEVWRSWLEARLAGRDPSLGIRGDLIQDPTFAARIFDDTGLGIRWNVPQRLWTLDESGAMNRLNLVGVDPELASALTGVSLERIMAFQAVAQEGLPDAAAAQAFWRFDEWQALEPWMTPRPFSTALWTLQVHVPSLREPIVTRWRVSTDESSPGNPWFVARPWPRELW